MTAPQNSNSESALSAKARIKKNSNPERLSSGKERLRNGSALRKDGSEKTQIRRGSRAHNPLAKPSGSQFDDAHDEGRLRSYIAINHRLLANGPLVFRQQPLSHLFGRFGQESPLGANRPWAIHLAVSAKNSPLASAAPKSRGPRELL